MKTLMRVALVVGLLLAIGQVTPALACSVGVCPGDAPTVDTGRGALIASYFEVRPGLAFASNNAPAPQTHHWRLLAACDVSDPVLGGCLPGVGICNAPPDRVVAYYVVQRQRLAGPDGEPVDGRTPPPDTPAGTGFGPWSNVHRGCVDVTDLNPPPTPGEVFRWFRALPLPQLPLRQQPPGNTALAGLPVIFFTDAPATTLYTVTIRGYRVGITATATSYAWHTGDGTTLTSTGPGAPYPRQTVTHSYRSGHYTASLTTTWGATYTVNGGPALTVAGSTTTDSPPVDFAVLQARAVLTNPYD